MSAEPCQDCVELALGTEARRSSYPFVQQFGKRRCDGHLEELCEDILIPVFRSYADWCSIPEPCDDLDSDNYFDALNSIYLNMRKNGVDELFDGFIDGEDRVQVDLGLIIGNINRALCNSAVEPEHADLIQQHFIATLSNTGITHPSCHELDLVLLAQDNPEILWSYTRGYKKEHVLPALALKIPQCPGIDQETKTVRLYEWMSSYLISRFYNGEGLSFSLMVRELYGSGVLTSGGDAAVLKYVKGWAGADSSDGTLCNLLFSWTDYISREEGKEVPPLEAVQTMQKRYRGFVRPQSFKTLRSRLRRDDDEISDETIRECFAAISEYESEIEDYESAPKDLVSKLQRFQLDAERIRRWHFDLKYDECFEGTPVDNYDDAKEWADQIKMKLSAHPDWEYRKLRVGDDLPNFIREQANTGAPLSWVLATLG